MALLNVTTTFDIHDLFGNDFDARRAKAWATNNADDQTIHDTSTGETRIGSGTATINADGTGTFTHWAPGADGNPVSWQTTYHFDVPDRQAPGGRRRQSFGPYTVTASGLLTALVEQQAVPATYLSQVTEQLDGYVADAETASASSAASAASAAASAVQADSYIVADLNTSDGQIEALIESPTSLTSAALSATIDAETDRHLAPKQIIERKIPDWITQFEPGHGFTASNVYTSFADDTTDFAFGGQAVRMVIDAASSTGRISKNGVTARDLTSKVPVVWVKVNDLAAIESIELYVGSSGLANYYRMGQWSPVAATRPTVAGRWTPIRFTKDSVSTTAGSPDWANITDWRIALNTSAAGNADVLVGGIGLVDDATQFPNGVVTFTFDDGIDCQFTTGRRILDKYGYPGVLGVVVERIETWAQSITPAQVKTLHDKHGWEIAGHAFTEAVHVARLTGVTEDEAVADLRQLKQWLLDNGYVSDNYVYPGGIFDAATVDLVSRYFNAARTTAGRPKMNLLNCLDPMYLTSEEPGATGLVNAKARIDEAYDNGLWLIENIHHVDAGGITEADFAELVDYIHAKGIEVCTMQQVFERLRIPTSPDALSLTTADARYRQSETLPQAPLFAIKSADTVRNNVATNPGTDDPHLTLTVAANAKYIVEAFLDYDSATAADLRIGWTTPAGTTMSWTGDALPAGATASTSVKASSARLSVSNTSVLGGIGVGVSAYSRPCGTLTTTTAGTVSLRWNQGTADATDTTLKAESWIKLTRIA